MLSLAINAHYNSPHFQANSFLSIPQYTNSSDFKNIQDYKLYIAAIEGNLKTIEKALEEGANPHAKHQRSPVTAIHAAIYQKASDQTTLAELKCLLKNTAFPNDLTVYNPLLSQEHDAHTPICLAILREKPECAIFLVKCGAQYVICTKSNCKGPLTHAVSLEHNPHPSQKAYTLIKTLLSDQKATEAGYDLLKTLLSQSQNKDQTKKVTEQQLRTIYNTALIKLVEASTVEVHARTVFTRAVIKGITSLYNGEFKVLVDSAHLPTFGATSAAFDNTKPINYPIEIAKLLLEKLKGSPNIPDRNGRTLLHHATTHNPVYRYYNIPLVQYLISKGADINRQDKEGNTVLHQFCRESNTFTVEVKEIIQHLIPATGADLLIKNKAGKTPFELLPDKYKDEIKTFFLRHLDELSKKWRLNQSVNLKGEHKPLPKEIQRAAVYFLTQLSKTHQSTLRLILGVKHPDQCSESTSKETIPPILTLPDELKLEILNDCFEDNFFNRDYDFLTPQTPPITPNSLLRILVETLPSVLQSAVSRQAEASPIIHAPRR